MLVNKNERANQIAEGLTGADIVIDMPERSELEYAAMLYIARNNGTTHPKGTFDRGGRWYPSESEHQPCCEYVRSPSRHFPFSLNRHCRSYEHIAELHGVTKLDLMREVRKIKAAKAGKSRGAYVTEGACNE